MSDRTLSSLVHEMADETRETARGYRDMRNILAFGGIATTALLNLTEGVKSMSTVDDIKFNAVGLAVTGLSALGMEYGNRKRQRWASEHDALSQELADLNL